MASNYTENYGLCQWEATDQVLRTEFNENNQKIDAALGTLAEQVEKKAEQALVDVLSQTMAQKADQSALSAEISARASKDTALMRELSGKGNCQICYMTYVGDGKASRTLTFSGKPLLVLIQESNLICRGIQGNQFLMCRSNGQDGELCPATWSGNSLAWQCENTSYGANYKGAIYYLVALMAADE